MLPDTLPLSGCLWEHSVGAPGGGRWETQEKELHSLRCADCPEIKIKAYGLPAWSWCQEAAGSAGLWVFPDGSSCVSHRTAESAGAASIRGWDQCRRESASC